MNLMDNMVCLIYCKLTVDYLHCKTILYIHVPWRVLTIFYYIIVIIIIII